MDINSDIILQFKQFPILETDRLLLRRILPRDADDMFEYSKSESITKYLLWKPHPDKDYTCKYIDFLQEKYDTYDYFDWAIVLKENQKMIGTVGFANLDMSKNIGEIGYVVNSDFQGKGYATEAADRILKFGFETLGLLRIEGKFISENKASLSVLRKIGMTYANDRPYMMNVKGKRKKISVCRILYSEFNNKQR